MTDDILISFAKFEQFNVGLKQCDRPVLIWMIVAHQLSYIKLNYLTEW